MQRRVICQFWGDVLEEFEWDEWQFNRSSWIKSREYSWVDSKRKQAYHWEKYSKINSKSSPEKNNYKKNQVVGDVLQS